MRRAVANSSRQCAIAEIDFDYAAADLSDDLSNGPWAASLGAMERGTLLKGLSAVFCD